MALEVRGVDTIVADIRVMISNQEGTKCLKALSQLKTKSRSN